MAKSVARGGVGSGAKGGAGGGAGGAGSVASGASGLARSGTAGAGVLYCAGNKILMHTIITMNVQFVILLMIHLKLAFIKIKINYFSRDSKSI